MEGSCADKPNTLKEQLTNARSEHARLTEAARATAAQVEQVRLEAQQALARLRTELEKSFQEQWDAELTKIQQGHAAATQERNAAIAMQLANASQDPEESERTLKEQLTNAQSEHARLTEAVGAAAALVEQVKVEAQQTQNRLRVEMEQQHQQSLAAQAAATATTHQTELNALLAKLEEVARDKQAAIEAANVASQEREAAAQATLGEIQARLADAEAPRKAIEEQLRSAEAAKAAEIAQVRELLDRQEQGNPGRAGEAI